MMIPTVRDARIIGPDSRARRTASNEPIVARGAQHRQVGPPGRAGRSVVMSRGWAAQRGGVVGTRMIEVANSSSPTRTLSQRPSVEKTGGRG